MERPDRRIVQRSVLRSLGVVAGLLVIYAVIPLRGEFWWLGATIGVLALAALIPVTIRRLRALQSSERPFLEVFDGLVLLLAMLVTGFAALYYGMDRHGTEFHGLANRVDSIYFTVTTLATVGYGDITPASNAARVIVTVQMLFDLAFLGLVVRALTSVARQRAGGRGIIDPDR